MDITAYPQIPSDIWKRNHSSAKKYRLTLECYDLLKVNGYYPADMGMMVVTLRVPEFKKLVKDHGGACSTKTIKSGRVSSVWWNQVEITCLETHQNEYSSWTLDEEWKRL